MPSPFPGMDPFLEDPSHWSDFHFTFINYWREAIAEQLPEEYEANVGERVYLVEMDPDSRKLIYPDIGVSDARIVPGAPAFASSTATLEPVTIPLETVEGPREAFIEILHRPDRELVGVLELLSPANKQEPGRTEYLSKRNAIIRQSVHLVELDLLLGGRRLPLRRPLPADDYYYLLARGDQRPECQVFHWSLAHALPRVPVPLRPPYADLMIDLGQVVSTAYDRARFGRRLAYGKPCLAPLRQHQEQWVREIVSSARHN
jgi:Protein of unknown function (DUF4058)